MKHIISLATTLVLWSSTCLAQENLVPNPSFEYNTGCPTSAGQVSSASPWVKVAGSGVISYYHECGTVCCGVPINRVGIEMSHIGEAYCEFLLVSNSQVISQNLEAQFLGTPLADTLESGKKYTIEFYLSLADSARFAGRNLGVYFSNGQPSGNVQSLLSSEPQFEYQGGFLTDKEGWTRISGDFIADGGENYMSIGL